ncbi:MAG: HAD-IA family hydrolase [Pseudonocardia sp.]
MSGDQGCRVRHRVGAGEGRRHVVAGAVGVSHEVGLAKPDPRIYKLTCDRLDVQPDEIVFLDDVEANVEAARQLGWRAVLHEETRASIRAINEILADA